jgi:hypothetical protein
MGIRVIQGANTIPPPKNVIYDVPSATESSPGTRTTSPLLSTKSQLDKKSSSADHKNEIKPTGGKYFSLTPNELSKAHM